MLTPIGEAQDFLIVDRGGDGSNLEEFHFSHAYEIHLPDGIRLMTDISLIDRLLDVIEHDIVPKTADGRGPWQQAVRRRDPAQGRPLAGARRNQQRDREPALARRSALPEALLRNAQGRARRHQGRASSSPRTSPARSACRRSPGPASTISTTCSATRIRATASPSRTI